MTAATNRERFDLVLGLLQSQGMLVDGVASILGALCKARRQAVADPILVKGFSLADVAACYDLLCRSWHLVERECERLLDVAVALPDIGEAEWSRTLPDAVLITGQFAQVESSGQEDA